MFPSMRTLILLGLLLGFGATSAASASPDYPAVLQEDLALSCQPSCLLCHTKQVGGFGTANTPFGAALRRVSLECCEEEQLAPALEKLTSSMVDSDQDGVPDVSELRAGTDPNAPDAGLACEQPRNDAGCRLSNHDDSSTLTSFAIVLCMAAGWRRRRYGQVMGIGRGVGR